MHDIFWSKNTSFYNLQDKLNEEKKQKKRENAKLEKEADRLQREAVETDEPEEMKRLIKQSLMCRDHIKREIESIKKFDQEIERLRKASSNQ